MKTYQRCAHLQGHCFEWRSGYSNSIPETFICYQSPAVPEGVLVHVNIPRTYTSFAKAYTRKKEENDEEPPDCRLEDREDV